jgi:hypothetical protein
MSENNNGHVADIELTSSWEGPAEHAPGVLFDMSCNEGHLARDAPVADLAGWVAVTALSGRSGNTASEMIKVKVRGVLVAWRRQQGQVKLDELKQRVAEEMHKHRPNGTLTEEELQGRIDAFFNEIVE